METISAKKQLVSLYNAALHAVDGRLSTASAVRNLDIKSDTYVFAVGKAAHAMMMGAYDVLGDKVIDALVINKVHYASQLPSRFTFVPSSHPVPDEKSIHAGEMLRDFVSHIPDDAICLALISGGASAMVEVLPGDLSLAAWCEVNRWLLASGKPIGEINFVRKQLSYIKGGRLAGYLAARETYCLLISDVLNNDMSVIGSGLLAAQSSNNVAFTVDEYPQFVHRALNNAGKIPQVDDQCFARINYCIVADIHRAMQGAERQARLLGYSAFVDSKLIQENIFQEGARIATYLLRANPGVYIWGGEPTVVLPQTPGSGGRCQSLALVVADCFDENKRKNITLLAAGTDGCDGPGPYAGAIVDGETLCRARGVLGNKTRALDYLCRADAGSLLNVSGDLFTTDATHTNVTDLVIALVT